MGSNSRIAAAYIDRSLRFMILYMGTTHDSIDKLTLLTKGVAALCYTAFKSVVTSGYRSPEHNREVGGVINSKHLTGEAFDVSPFSIHNEKIDPLNLGVFVSVFGFRLLDEGDHYHIQVRK